MLKEIKFTKENLEKHLSVCDVYVVTGRDELKADLNDRVTLQGVDGIWKVEAIDGCLNIHNYSMVYYIMEGFKNAHELENELGKIYGTDAQIYAHWLKKEI